MSNEPVAWMVETSDDITFMLNIKGSSKPDNSWDKVTPVYTHPAKTLTDEEIWEVIDNCFGVHAFNLNCQIALDEAREDAFELVKAILRKAQEK